jgi:hypothetical protein
VNNPAMLDGGAFQNGPTFDVGSVCQFVQFHDGPAAVEPALMDDRSDCTPYSIRLVVILGGGSRCWLPALQKLFFLIENIISYRAISVDYQWPDFISGHLHLFSFINYKVLNRRNTSGFFRANRQASTEAILAWCRKIKFLTG